MPLPDYWAWQVPRMCWRRHCRHEPLWHYMWLKILDIADDFAGFGEIEEFVASSRGISRTVLVSLVPRVCKKGLRCRVKE